MLPSGIGCDLEELAQRLISEGQGHLFEQWDTLDGKDVEKKQLLDQLYSLDQSYPGGLRAYIRKAKELLERSKNGLSPYEGCTPSVPDTNLLNFSTQMNSAFAKTEQLGYQAFGKCACVLVAGGLGERLGYSGIKLALPSEVTSMTSFLKLYCNFISALEPLDVKIPLVIMTSDDTHQNTQKLLEENKWFGLEKDQVSLLKQEKVPSISDIDGRIALEPGNPFKILCKPHGHGDVHLLLEESGLPKLWLDQGLEHILFLQDTTPMSFRTLVAALGVSVQKKYLVNVVSIPRRAKAAAGAWMRLTRKDKSETTLNVEYNYVDNLLRSSYWPDGDVNDPDTGYSPFPGNTNQLIFALDSYVSILARTKGFVPEFINPKYTNVEKTLFKPARLECMMQDYPLCLGPEDAKRMGVTVFADLNSDEEKDIKCLTHRLYAPAKNNLKAAAINFAKGIPDGCSGSTELSVYACYSLALRDLGCRIEGPRMSSYGEIKQPEWPHIVLLPRFLPVFSNLNDRWSCPNACHISATSSLVLDGDISIVGSFSLDGALSIYAGPGVQVVLNNVHVKNEGAEFMQVEDDEKDEFYRIRGFKYAKNSHWCRRNYIVPGKYVEEIISLST